jgi:hypothetical protein
VWEQAKSERRPNRTFTCHAQLFHKHKNCASAEIFRELQGFSEGNLLADARVP